MAQKTISPRYLFYYGTIVHLVALITISILFKIVSENIQIIPMIVMGFFFIATLLLTLLHLNRQVHIQVLGDNNVVYRSLFTEGIVPLKSINCIKHVWFNTYRLKINGKKYMFYGFKTDVEYLKDLVDKSKA